MIHRADESCLSDKSILYTVRGFSESLPNHGCFVQSMQELLQKD
jgi:hypothetical protein